MRCSRCGSVNGADSRFCGSCGAGMEVASGWADCPDCGAPTAPGSGFCRKCGAAFAPSGATLSVPDAGSPSGGFGALIAVLVSCSALALFGWVLVGWPAYAVKMSLLPAGTVSCGNIDPNSSAFYACSAKVAGYYLLPVIGVAVFLFLLRKQIAAFGVSLIPTMPSRARFLAAPLLATLCFAMSWSAIHFESGTRVWAYLAKLDLSPLVTSRAGDFSQVLFPGVVGLFTYCAFRYGPGLQQQLSGLFDARDRLPKVARFAVVIVAPMAVSPALSSLAGAITGGQLVVLISLAAAYVALAPRVDQRAKPMRRQSV